MKKFAADDTGNYLVRFRNAAGAVVAPDLDDNLSLEFYDSAGTLRFTATTTSDPAIQVGSDAAGDYIYVSEIPLTDFVAGVVEARVYGNIAGVSISPSPWIFAGAFEVIEGYAGYACTPAQVRAIGNLPDSFDSAAIAAFLPAARRRLKTWVTAAYYADAILATPTDADRAEAVAEAEAHLTVAEGLPTWSRRIGSAGNLSSGRDGDKNSWTLRTVDEVNQEVSRHLAAAERAVAAWYGDVTPVPVAVGAKTYDTETDLET